MRRPQSPGLPEGYTGGDEHEHSAKLVHTSYPQWQAYDSPEIPATQRDSLAHTRINPRIDPGMDDCLWLKWVKDAERNHLWLLPFQIRAPLSRPSPRRSKRPR